MTEMFSIARASLRISRAAWHCPLPSGAKLVLLCIISHYNDARGVAFPSVARVAALCGLHQRTVQHHLALLLKMGLLQAGQMRGICTKVYRINEAALLPPATPSTATGAENLPAEVAFPAPAGADFSAQSAEIATQNGCNEFEPIKITEAPAQSVPAPRPAPPESSASSLFLQALQNPQDQAALQAWQQVRQAKKRPALPNALQCQQLLDYAAALGKPLGWLVQVMALNDWTLFDPAWLNNQRPPPRLPTVATPLNQQTPTQRPLHKPPEPESLPVTAEQSAQAKARMASLLHQWRTPEPTSSAPIQPCGIAWADQIIANALRGQSVGFAALEMACSVAKVSRRAVRAAAKATVHP